MVPEGDGFSGFVDSYEDSSEQSNPRVIQGTRIKFNDPHWTDGNGAPLDLTKELVVVKVLRCVQKWSDEVQHPVETRVLRPGEPFPNIDAMNQACPEAEWREDPFTKSPKGPWEAEHVLYLTSSALDKFTFTAPVAPKATVGSVRAVEQLVDKVNWMQRYREPGILAVVLLSSVHMPTKYGGRMRPHFEIIRWLAPGGDVVEPLALPPSNRAAAEVIPPTKAAAKTSTKTVKKPSSSEDPDDEIPW